MSGFVQLTVFAAVIRAKEHLGAFALASGTVTYALFACSLVAFQALPFLIVPAAAKRGGGRHCPRRAKRQTRMGSR